MLASSRKSRLAPKSAIPAANAGISDACYYQWKSKYAGMEVSQLAKMRELQAENAKLKKMYGELGLKGY